MPYLGRYAHSDRATKTRKLDSMAASFNSACTVFSMTSSGVALYPLSARNLLISINGVVQEPDVAYTVSGSTLTFTAAPSTGATFFGVLNSEPYDASVQPVVTSLTTNTANVFGDITITGNTSVGATLTVTGLANITGNTTINGTARIVGATTLGTNATSWSLWDAAKVQLNTGFNLATYSSSSYVLSNLYYNSGYKYALGTGLYGQSIKFDAGTGDIRFSVTAASGNADAAANVVEVLTLSKAGALNVVGDLTVNTSKFSVASATGNANVAGTLGVASDLTVATDKLKVVAATGNITAAGYLYFTVANNRYVIVDTDATYAGRLTVQAGGGSQGFGGGLNLYGHSHATFPGWVKAGISSASGGKFAVNTQGLGGGTDVFTVDASGNGVFSGSVGMGISPSYKLDVNGSGSLTGSILRIWNPNTSWGAEATIRAYADGDNSGYPAVDFGYFRGTAEGGGDASSGFIIKTGTRDSVTSKFIVNKGGNVGIGTLTPAYQLQLSTNSGAKPGGGSWTDSSDERLKTNIQSMTDMTILRGLHPVWFDWKNPGEHDNTIHAGGFIAQEVLSIIPEWVGEVNVYGKDRELVEDKAYTLQLPTTFSALLVAGWQSHDTEITQLKAEIAQLKSQLLG